MLNVRTKGLLAGLLYPVIFEEHPEAGIERVIDLVVSQNALGATASDYLHAIEDALATKQKLSKIIPLRHDEEAVRRYLRQLADKLAGMLA